jgi:hypothetical protein
MHSTNHPFQHPAFTRRTALQAGAIGLLGLGSNHLAQLRAASAYAGKPRACIYVFLSGGLSQHDSFDMKPDAADNVRGEFKPIACRTPGTQICEHLPRLAARSHLWSLVRSLTHRTNGHSEGHHMMLTGRSDLPPGFNGSMPKPTDWPCLASIVGAVTRPRNNLPPAAVLPERFVHYSGRVIPGQFAGNMGKSHDPWFIEASPYHPGAYGAYPTYEFDHQRRQIRNGRTAFSVPDLSLPQGVTQDRLFDRIDVLRHVDEQRHQLDRLADSTGLDTYRQSAVSLLTDAKVRRAFDIAHASERDLDRYGRHSFGWSLLLARRLVEAGVNMVQVNLGNNETWDTHGFIFPHLKDKLFPPADQALSALLDDLHESGLLESTLIFMAGEFGRTPRVTTLKQFYALPGRDHWGALQTVFFAGGGVQGGRVVGSSDKIGAFPKTEPQTPENMAATLFHCLGLPKTVAWHDALNRPHHIYQGEPIAGLV